MKRINREGPPLLGGARRPPLLPAPAILGLADQGALVIDTRAADAYAGEHVSGTINIPLTRSFNTWAGWLIPYDRDFHLLVEDDSRLDEAVRDLSMVGLDRVAGYLRPEALEAWTAAGRTLSVTKQMSVDELAAAMQAGEVSVLDVRDPAEWAGGHLPGVANVPLGYLQDRLAEVPRDRPVVVHCQGGGRSAIAASMLEARGVDAVNLAGGYRGWAGAGRPVERPEDRERCESGR
jgi:hydroxyacylglutathione hydrolase